MRKRLAPADCSDLDPAVNELAERISNPAQLYYVLSRLTVLADMPIAPFGLTRMATLVGLLELVKQDVLTSETEILSGSIE